MDTIDTSERMNGSSKRRGRMDISPAEHADLNREEIADLNREEIGDLELDGLYVD